MSKLKNKKALAIAGIILYFLCVYILNLVIDIKRPELLATIAIGITIIITQIKIVKKYKIEKMIDYKLIIKSIIIVGIIIRTAYILYTPITERQHDVDVGYKYGQMDYIETIYKTGKLPNKVIWQYYQQPLHHIISAIWLKVNDICGVNLYKAEEGIQFLTAIYSSLIMIISYDILKELEIDDKYKTPILAIMAIHPTFIILSGSINNDILSILFTFLSLLYIIKWYKKSNWKNTILLALFVALGALTKIATTAIAIPILYVFIKKFIEGYKENKNVKFVLKYLLKIIIFEIIAMGLGLSYSARNKIKFGQDLMYVPSPAESLYCGDRSVWTRINPFSKEFANVFCNPFEDSNMFAYLVKCSLFGEYSIENLQNTVLERMMIITNITFIVLSIVSLIKIIKKEKSTSVKSLIVFYITEIAMYVYGNFSKPYGCTMDFRYITPTVFLGMLFIILDIKRDKTKGKYNSVLAITTLFSVLAICFELLQMRMLTI